MNAVVKIEPIPLPDLRRPGMMPSLPGWLASSSAAVRSELQPTPEGFRDLMVLPEERLPTPSQKQAIEDHIHSLHSLLGQTAVAASEFEDRVALAITKLLLVLPGAKKSDVGSEARNEAYLAVLDDVPCWAVESAIRLWYRGDCGTDERGKPYDYHWAPVPADLRRIAMREASYVARRIEQIKPVLLAKPYVDCTKQLEQGRAAWKGLRSVANNEDALKALTFAKAVELGGGAA